MKNVFFILAVFLSFPAWAAAIDKLTVAHENGSFALGAPTYVNVRVLAANTAETITVPTGSSLVSFAANCDFYANYTTTATVPAADVTDGTGNEMNPLFRIVSGSSISVISASACIITASFYR